ncbi:cellulose binding domain-containing protein [Nonomuraea jabiensis]|uniref:cellulose binding domain-containing protein n=1 Tax=Nonomuraea jabiensis TaxID=882448 RepID=UPI00161CC9BF
MTSCRPPSSLVAERGPPPTEDENYTSPADETSRVSGLSDTTGKAPCRARRGRHGAGTSAINGWTVTWNWPGSQSVTQLWEGVRSGAAPSVSVRNESWNGRLAADATATFCFTATGTAAASALTCTAT